MGGGGERGSVNTYTLGMKGYMGLKLLLCKPVQPSGREGSSIHTECGEREDKDRTRGKGGWTVSEERKGEARK